MKHESFPLTFTEDAVRDRYINQNYGLRFPFSVRSQVTSTPLRERGSRVTVQTGIIVPKHLLERIHWEATPHLFRGTYNVQLGDDGELLLVATLGSTISHRFSRGDLIGKLTLKEAACAASS
jgi:hypothetical protein